VPRLLEVTGLSTHFPGAGGNVRAVDGVSFHVDEGETLGLVGESGCGKSITALSLLRLVPQPGRIVSGRIVYKGSDLMTLPERGMRRVRGREIALVFQEPSTALNPVFTVGYQIAEGLIVHGMMKKKEALREAVRLMEVVRIPDAARRATEYPHQMSGGMRQRVMIAMALACRPALLVADEPTTALDVTIQAEILDLLLTLKRDFHLSLLLITHNMGVIAETADRVAVMDAGRIAEIGPVRDVIKRAKHPYTQGLMGAIPSLGADKDKLAQIDGAMPRLTEIPRGCAFNPRCPKAFDRCKVERPEPMGAGNEKVACWLYADTPAREVAHG